MSICQTVSKILRCYFYEINIPVIFPLYKLHNYKLHKPNTVKNTCTDMLISMPQFALLIDTIDFKSVHCMPAQYLQAQQIIFKEARMKKAIEPFISLKLMIRTKDN